MSGVQGIDMALLFKNIDDGYNLGELNVLAFSLGIDLQDVPGSAKKEKIVEFIRYCQRHGRLLDLISQCRQERPRMKWSQDIQPQPASMETVEERINHRRSLYKQADGIQLVHTILPSKRVDDYWDILIYLIRHKSDDLSIVEYAEFFLGQYWGNQIFRATNSENFIGIAVSAYGPALCTCRVVFTDGKEVMLDRYIDLEMTGSLKANKEEPKPSPLPSVSTTEEIGNLRDLMNQQFTQDEIRDLLFTDLDIEYEALSGDTKVQRIHSLIRQAQLTGRLSELLAICKQRRPHVQWDDVHEET